MAIRQQDLAIDRASGDDLDAVLPIMQAAFDPRFGEAWTRNQCAGILPMAGVSLSIARMAGQPVGFSLARRTLDEAELLLIAVDPRHGGRGIGGRLVTHFLAEQQQAGATNLHLEVRDGNPAVHLYRKLGFLIAGRRDRYYRGGAGETFDALTMVYRP